MADREELIAPASCGIREGGDAPDDARNGSCPRDIVRDGLLVPEGQVLENPWEPFYIGLPADIDADNVLFGLVAFRKLVDELLEIQIVLIVRVGSMLPAVHVQQCQLRQSDGFRSASSLTAVGTWVLFAR